MFNSRYSNNLAFVDLLFNFIIGLTFLFIVSFLMINEPKREDNTEPMAEYMIILSWDAESDVDIDLWIHGPSGVVGFQTPVSGFMYLDKDDLGHRNDYVWVNGEKKILKLNREIVNIRGFHSGEYVVNIHYYGGPEAYKEVPANVEVIKLNPFSVVYEASPKLIKRGQEETIVRFTMDGEGNYSNINQLKKTIVYQRKSGIDPVIPSINHPGGL